VQVLNAAREQRERDLLEALANVSRQQQATTAVERKLAEARAQRYANPVAYVLAALLRLSAARAAFFWHRARVQPRRRAAAEPGLAGRA
jgi:hypothetical protein